MGPGQGSDPGRLEQCSYVRHLSIRKVSPTGLPEGAQETLTAPQDQRRQVQQSAGCIEHWRGHQRLCLEGDTASRTSGFLGKATMRPYTGMTASVTTLNTVCGASAEVIADLPRPLNLAGRLLQSLQLLRLA